MGGKYKCNYVRSNYELILDIFKDQFAPMMETKRIPIAFRYMKNVGHYYVSHRRDLFCERASFGVCCTKKELFIAGG